MGGLVFYQVKGQYYVRKKPDVDRKYMEARKGYERTLENSAEFGACTKSGMLLRHSLGHLLKDTADNEITQRVNALMSRIKNLDPVSPRGKRTVANGLKNPAALKEIKGFNFNKDVPLESVLLKPAVCDHRAGIIRIAKFNPRHDLKKHRLATHVKLEACRLRINFLTGTSESSACEKIIPINDLCQDQEMQLPQTNMHGGMDIYLLKTTFCRMEKNALEPLRGRTSRAVRVVGVEVEEEFNKNFNQSVLTAKRKDISEKRMSRRKKVIFHKKQIANNFNNCTRAAYHLKDQRIEDG
jgi:hypothetical protein